MVAPALIDRLLHQCHIVNIRGNSYSMRLHTLWSQLRGDSASASSPKQRTKKK